MHVRKMANNREAADLGWSCPGFIETSFTDPNALFVGGRRLSRDEALEVFNRIDAWLKTGSLLFSAERFDEHGEVTRH